MEFPLLLGHIDKACKHGLNKAVVIWVFHLQIPQYTDFIYKQIARWVQGSVVPINRITIGNSRLSVNFLTIGIGRFYDYTISFLKSDNLITLYLKLNQIFVINLLILTGSYNLCILLYVCSNRYQIKVSAVWNLK